MGAFFRELLRANVYKRSQGRITRQVTFAAVALAIALGLWRLSSILVASNMAAGTAAWLAGRPILLPLYWIAGACAWIAATPGFFLWFPGLLLLLTLWATYRLVNVPAFADFLIAVEAEMNKVSWPTRPDLFRASMVVLALIFSLAIVLAVFEYSWTLLFRKVLHIM